MRKLFIIGLIALGISFTIVVAGVIGLFYIFERGEKPLSASEVVQRLTRAGFEIELQNRVLLYANDEALLPEKPATIQTLYLKHPDIGSGVVTAASFSNEKVSLSLKGKTNGFPIRNWFFFGIVNTAMTEQIQVALKTGEGDLVIRLKTFRVESKIGPEVIPIEVTITATQKKREELLSRGEVLQRFISAGLKINRIEENKEMPLSVKKKLPTEPLNDFLLFIEDEGIFPIEFSSTREAIQMQKNHKKGFRYGNWYFPGQITAGLRKKLENALADI